MVIFYFSGTGNSKFVAEQFSNAIKADCHSIEDDAVNFNALIESNEDIGFCYPVYFSRVPRIMREFAIKHIEQLKNKKLIILCTQMILSGDGARAFTDLFPNGYINVKYAEHFIMPNNVPNYPWLPKVSLVPSESKIKKCITSAEHKIQMVCHNIRNGVVKKRGFNIFSKILGLPQGVTALAFEKKANESVVISDNCNACGLCVSVCPMKNLSINNGAIKNNHNCTICYRCVNKCPQKAITVLFNERVAKPYKGLNSLK